MVAKHTRTPAVTKAEKKRERARRKAKRAAAVHRAPHRKGERPAQAICDGCGQPRDDRDGLRMVHVSGAGWLPDERQRLDGPSLEVHCLASCVEALAARVPDPDSSPVPTVDLEQLRRTLAHWIDERVLQALSRVAAAGQVVGGHDVLRDAIARGEVTHVLVASDAAPRTLRSLERSASDSVTFHTLELTRDALGSQVGQPPRAAVGVPSSRAAAPLRQRLAMRTALRMDPQP